MKLPENYENWIEFAKHCNKILEKYPDATTVKQHTVMNQRGYSEFNIDTVKTKAFDEIIEKINFNFGHIMHLRDAGLSRGCHFKEINNITDLLLNLIK